MSTPPANRRPGVDADIVQASTVRGYDGPQLADDPCDLIISNGRNEVDGRVADLLFWNRTDVTTQGIFTMVVGPDVSTGNRFEVYAGDLATPDGVVTAPVGSLYVSDNPSALYQNQDGGTTWKAISDELGGENLEETLAIGDFTGSERIVISSGSPGIVGEEGTGGAAGADVNVMGGPATGITGDGGHVILTSGTSAGGTTGNVYLLSADPTGSESSGGVFLTTADSTSGGASGGIRLETGDVGAPGLGGGAGAIILRGGSSSTTGLLGTAGRMVLHAGEALTDGQGGNILIMAGSSSAAFPIEPIPIAVAGHGGGIVLRAGSSSQSQVGGGVSISAGDGGSAGATGGDVSLTPGSGGGGFADGEIVGNGVLRSDNIKRGTADPNVAAVTGDEGAIYQRTDLGLGQLWLNTNGSPTGWVQLAFAGDFVESFEQLQWGYLCPAGNDVAATVDDRICDLGIWKGMIDQTAGLGTITIGGATDTGPHLNFQVDQTAAGNQAALDLDTGTGSLPHAREHGFIATFRAKNTQPNEYRIFMGLTGHSATNQLSGSLPAGAPFIGFKLEPTLGDWQAITSTGAAAQSLNMGYAVTNTMTQPGTSFFVIDATDTATPLVRFYIFDDDLNLQATQSTSTFLPTLSARMGVVVGCRSTTLGAGTGSLYLQNACIVNQANVVGQGGGAGLGALTLAQVLINGNTTGNNPIVVNQLGGGIVGETDDNFGDGADVAVFGGPTTGAVNDSGSITVSSGNRLVVGGTGDTGVSLFGTGWQFDPTATGVTGDLTISSGLHAGTGATGTVIIASGAHTGVTGGVQGDIEIAPGTFFPVPATATGDLMMKGGSSSVVGVSGGDVFIASGENSSASGDTGDVSIESWDVNQAGDSGDVSLVTGDGGSSTGDSGAVGLRTGAANVGDTGDIILLTGSAVTGQAGDVSVLVGNTTSGNGGAVNITSGTTVDAGGTGGDITLTPGTGPALDGRVIVNGKLTVTGMIDPTGLVLSGVGSAPVTIVGNDGLLWVDGTGPDGRLMYQNSAGSWDITTGGGATTLGALTDVTITAPAPGEILTLNGGLQWVNLPGAGGSGLPTVLGIDATTGGTAGGITVSDTLGDRIASDGDLVLDPAVAPGSSLVLDGLRWPEADGTAGFVLTTNGAGQLSWQAGGGGGTGGTFAEQFASMQWGSAQAVPTGAVFAFHGIFATTFVTSGLPPVPITSDQGTVRGLPTGAVLNQEAGVFVTGSTVRLDARPLAAFHFDLDAATTTRLFVGLTSEAVTATPTTMLASTTPAERYVGVQLCTDVPQTNFTFVTDDNTGTPTRSGTGYAPTASDGFWLTVDATVSGEVTLRLYDEDRNLLDDHTFTSNLPTATADLNFFLGVRTLAAVNRTLSVWEFSAVTRADLLAAVGGGGNQNLTSVLGFGNATGGLPIQGDDNAGGTGVDLDLLGGSSTGGGGSGGDVNVVTGLPDGAGNGDGGDLHMIASAGVGSGDGGDFLLAAGPGGVGGGSGGDFFLALGAGSGAGSGGNFLLACGPGGSGGGTPGSFLVATGSATGGGATGGGFQVACGVGDGAGAGGVVQFVAGNGGATGSGGNIELVVGTGGGGSPDGIVDITGDVDITGKLTVSGLIDPTGLLMSSVGAVPFTPVGNDGGIWVNGSGELVYTNAGGDLNLSTAIGGGMGFLDALLIAGYGFLGPGNLAGGPQSYGVYGSSVAPGVAPSASINFGADTGGPLLNLAVGAAAASEAWISTVDHVARRDARFKAIFKFQVASPSHADERIFIGFSDGVAVVPPSIELSADDPATLEYMGLRQDAAGVNLEFVARGSGGAMVPVFALPTDAAVHYLQIDASAATGNVTFTVYDADGVTISAGGAAQYVAPASLLLPSLTTALRPFVGVHTVTGSTPRTVDFYFSSIVTRADVVDSVVGLGGGGIGTLAQVLAVGNLTGGTDIELTNSSQIVGEDLATGAGGNVEVIAGDETAGGPGTSGGTATLVPGAVTGAAGGDAGQVWLGASLAGGTGIAGNAGSGVVDGGDGGELRIFLGAGGANTSGDAGDAGDLLVMGDVGGSAQDGVSPVTAGSGSAYAWLGMQGGSAQHSAGSAVAGDGGDYYTTTGMGGTAQGTSGATGGDGGDYDSIAGAGSSAQSTASGTATGGAGGERVLVLGAGGASDGFSGSTAGSGGEYTLVTGIGGAASTNSTGTALGGDGGDLTAVLGLGGQAAGHTGATGGDGGMAANICGNGGNAQTITSGPADGGDGGDFLAYCGDGGDGTGIDAASGGVGGALQALSGDGGTAQIVSTGPAIGGAAGDFQGALGSGGAAQGDTGATGGHGGDFAFTLGAGGNATLTGGGTAQAGDGGGLLMVFGNGGDADAGAAGGSDADAGDGGPFQMVAGTGGDADNGTVAGTAGDGGYFEMLGGDGGSGIGANNEGGDGGHILGLGGNGGAGTGTEDGGDGGFIYLMAGSAGAAGGTGTDGVPGDVIISAGAAAAGGTGGRITFGQVPNQDVIDDASPAMQFGVFPIPAPGLGPWVIPFNAPFSAPPRVVLITVEAAAVPGQDVAVVPGSIAAGVGISFQVAAAAPLTPPTDFIHWVAYL